jgi:2-polyprenyl-3-methyl-5-hydroxy-6-metoxy-1,4-benzoquinol methylase
VRVLEFAQLFPGPYAGLVLSELGADVVKVEPPTGDPARAVPPFVEDSGGGAGAIFCALNRGKRSVAFDVKDPEARPAIERLIERSDVVLQNFTPGRAERVGVGEEAVRALRPDVVYVDISGYGPDGPYARKNAYDLVMQGETGLLAVTGTPAHPARVGISVCDIGAGSGYLGERLHRQHGESIRYIRVEPAARITDVFPPRPWETVLRSRCPGLPLPDESVDVVLSSLVLHHVPDETLGSFLRESRDLSARIVIHHDLVRSSIAYGLTWLLTRLITNSFVAQSDGPLSVRRSRTPEEWEEFLRRKKLTAYRIETQFPWRINLRREKETTTE